MKFMTPATVKNLPAYLAEDRQRSLLKREMEEKQEEKNNRQKFAEFSSRVLDLTMKAKNQDDLYNGLNEIKTEFAPYLSPEMMQTGAQAVRQWQADRLAQEERTKQGLLEKQGMADADAASRILGQKAGLMGQDSAGGDEYSVPVSQQDLLSSMSPKGRLGMTETLLGYQAKEAEKRMDSEKWQTDKALKEAQRQKYEAEALYNKNVRGRSEGGDNLAQQKFNKQNALETLGMYYPELAMEDGGSITLPANEAIKAIQTIDTLGFAVYGEGQEDSRGALKRAYDAVAGNRPEEMITIRRGGWKGKGDGYSEQPQAAGGNEFDDLLAFVTGGDNETNATGQGAPQVPTTDQLDSVIAGQTNLFGSEGGSGQTTEKEISFNESDVITVIDDKPVVRDKREGLLVYDNGEMRPPTKEESLEIRIRAQRGQLSSPKGWKYKTKFPNQKPMASPGQAPTLPNISGRM